MTDDAMKKTTRKTGRHLRVPVLPHEEQAIKDNAASVGLPVAAFLRNVGIGYEVRGIVDNLQVEELARINGDLGRLGGLIKLWLTNDKRMAGIGAGHLRKVLARIEANQEQMRAVMTTIVRPKADR